MRDIGIVLHSCSGYSDEEYIKRIADLGFKATFSGVCDKKRQYDIANLCDKTGVTFETLHAPFPSLGINGMWLMGPVGSKMLKDLKASVDNCVLAGVGILVVHLSSGELAPPVTNKGRARFTELVEYAARKNVKIAFENQRKLANISWAFEAFPKDSNVGFCWDLGHESCFTIGREYMPLFGDRLICTHIHDNFGVYNGDEHIIPFDGKIDYNRKMELIKKYGYEGSLMLEVFKNNFYKDITNEEYLEKAAKAAKKLAQICEE